MLPLSLSVNIVFTAPWSEKKPQINADERRYAIQKRDSWRHHLRPRMNSGQICKLVLKSQGRKCAAPKKCIKAPLEEITPFHIMDKKDLEKELSRIETEFGMAPEEFHKAWKEGKVHGHEAMKLSYYYEFYKDEYE